MHLANSLQKICVKLFMELSCICLANYEQFDHGTTITIESYFTYKHITKYTQLQSF
jgi:hypothetical protein